MFNKRYISCNSLDIKFDPWSVRILSGIPNLAITDTSSLAIVIASVLGMGIASR